MVLTFSDLNGQILITLSCLNLYLTFQVDEPLMSFNDNMSNAKTLYEKWEHFNQMNFMIMKSKIIKNIKALISTST